jgi:hypothetical protein
MKMGTDRPVNSPKHVSMTNADRNWEIRAVTRQSGIIGGRIFGFPAVSRLPQPHFAEKRICAGGLYLLIAFVSLCIDDPHPPTTL